VEPDDGDFAEGIAAAARDLSNPRRSFTMYEDVTVADISDRDLGVLVGSDQAKSALQVGATEALRRKTPLTVLTAYPVPVPIYPNMASDPTEPDGPAQRRIAEATLDIASDYLKDYSGEVILIAVEGNPTGTLAEFSEQARLTIVGARGRGGFVGSLLGSVASVLPAHAHGPTIVVPGGDAVEATAADERFVEQNPSGPIVAAIDGSAQSTEILEQAAHTAEKTAAPLKILMVMPLAEEWLYWYPDIQLLDESSRKRQSELEKTMRLEHSWLYDDHPTLDIAIDVESGQPIDVISDQTADAQLTVVDSRGRGAVRSAPLGSVSRDVRNNAQDPVMMVPRQA
jgi:nucleotide-binding universal stress UspA family protein